MSAQVEAIVRAYKTLCKVPSLSSGRVGGGGRSARVTWSARALDRGKLAKFATQYLYDDDFNVLASSDFGTDVTNELLSSVSPCEKYRAVIREEQDKDGKKQFAEVWSRGALRSCVQLAALDLHGDVYADGEFGCLSWNADSTAVAYVAERKPDKVEPYHKRQPADAKKDSGDAPPVKGEEFVYRQDWGEQLVGKKQSVIVEWVPERSAFSLLHGLPPHCCPGQISYTPEGDIVGVAWHTEPRRLGLIFCTNRPGFVFRLTRDGKFSELSSTGLAVRWVRASGSGHVSWLQRAAAGPHHAAHQLVCLPPDQEKPSVVIDIVERETETANGHKFHGVFSQALPRRCFSKDGDRIVFSTPQRNEIRSYVVDLEDGRLVDISIRSQPGSTSVLDVSGDVILAAFSNITTPHEVHVCRLPARGREDTATWRRLTEPAILPAPLSDVTVHYLHLNHDGSSDTVTSFSAIYSAPSAREEQKVPLVVWPHGGPHSNFVNAYSLETAFFNMLGLACLQVNYRGSSGAGQASVAFLPGRAGRADVDDCHLAAQHALRTFPLDDRNVCLFGGSHGGFLVCHLSGQFPDAFRAVVTRNPVVDVATMVNTTDIPDWCLVEAGFPFCERGPVSEEELVWMRRCSPLAHVHNVVAPTALMLGTADKRVPYYQGLDYSRRLKANGVETKVYMYEDNHSLSSLPVETDNLINSARWILEHLKQ